MRFKKFYIWISIFLSLSVMIYYSGKLFGPRLGFWENAVIIVREHTLNLSSVPVQILTLLEKIVIFADTYLNIFPTWVRLNWWDVNLVYLIISVPTIVILTTLFITLKNRWLVTILLIWTILWLIPITSLMNSAVDNYVTRTHWGWKTPFSPNYVWMWTPHKDGVQNPYSAFKYQWKQNNGNSKANIIVSCLGEYLLSVNSRYVYHGPSFAVPPKIYYDNIEISQYIHPGDNEIMIICNYSNEKHHQRVTYKSPGLLVGGTIRDGLFYRNIADNRLWVSDNLPGWRNGERISMDSGYSEELDLTIENKFNAGAPSPLAFSDFHPIPRPLPLLTQKNISITNLNASTLDLGRTRNGYLTISGHTSTKCKVLLKWGEKLLVGGKIQETAQNDLMIFPIGPIDWEQFSRRSGRYIQIYGEKCLGELKFGFKSVSMPYDVPELPNFSNKLDDQIFNLALNTLENNVQDHFEDSIVREKAMYIGDAREISRCLTVDSKNLNLVREMINQFSQSQNEDGSMPAMTPSGNPVVIYDYILQWVVWLDDYLAKSNDTHFAIEMWPSVEKVLTYFKRNESQDGLLKPKEWVFIDWTGIDRSYPYITSLQAWYYQALLSGASISNYTGIPKKQYRNEAEDVLNKIVKYGYDQESGLFVDSFSLSEKSSAKGLVTNALAGKLGLFQDRNNEKRLIYFGNKLFTADPFSESWVIEWLIKEGKEDLALQTMRKYWGGMISEGATAIYETYTPGIINEPASYSHAWGCGPIYLYKDLNKNIKSVN